VEKMRQSPQLRTPLLLRFRSHQHNCFCAVVGYLIRNGYYSENIIPVRCITCAGHLIAKSNDPSFPLADSISLRTYLGAACQQNLRLLTETNLNWYPIVRDFWNTLREVRNMMIRQEATYIEAFCVATIRRNHQNQLQAFTEDTLHRHPFNISFQRPAIRQWIRQRMAPWKEEIIAKGWHPSRMQHWCLDIEEQKDMGVDEIPPAPLKPGEPAEWNIRL
jgi:hypothetical protein